MSSSAAASTRAARFADFELDLQSGELRSAGATIRLPDQPFQILLMLLERPGEVVTREELRDRLWTADTFVDFDTGLNSAVRKLREALGDSADHPRFIETLPRRGYRLIAPVSGVSNAEAISTPSARRRMLRVVAAVALLIAAGVAGFLLIKPAPREIDSIAILPLANLTADRAQDYFADGMTDALIEELSQLRGVRVISRTSTMQYRDRPKSLSSIARELNVDGLIEGTVVRTGTRVRVTAQMHDARAGRRLWTGTYDRELGDVLILQHELAQAVAAAVRAELGASRGDSGRLARHVNPQAYDSYLRSHSAAGKGTTVGLKEAIAYVQDATARQPDFAAAWSAMARYYLQGAFVGLLSPQECLRRAEVAARTALELDPLLPDAHTAQANILSRQWKWVDAEKEYLRAIELAPSDAAAHRAYSAFLTNLGRPEEALREARRAIALDPLLLQAQLDLGLALRGAGRFDESISAYREALARDPNVPRAHYQLGRTYLAAGQTQNAIVELESAVDLSKRNHRYLYHLGYAYGRAGRADDARKVLAELMRGENYVSPVGLALIHAGLGDREAALASLEKAYQERAIELAELRDSTAFKSLYGDPRFQELLSKIGLPIPRSE